MSTAIDVMKKFMQSLANTSLYQRAALDEATRASSSYSSWQDVIDNMVTDARFYREHNLDTDTFLREKCGILLNNDDTGAITGFDAGNGYVKNNESVVPEYGDYVYPSSGSSYFNGLTVTWPSESSLSSSEKLIVGALNSWWIQSSLNLLEESYGLSFSGSNPSVSNMNVEFVNDYSGALAQVQYSYSTRTGKATDLTLQINMRYFDNVYPDNPNGLSPNTDAYLDRTVSHELTHAIVAATVKYSAYLPDYFNEGLAELTHGIDDWRKSNITNLAGNSGWLQDVLKYNTDAGEDTYAGGYMLLRYFAKNAADRQLPSGAQVFGTDMNLLSDFNNEIWLAGRNVFTGASTYQNDSIINVDGSRVTGDALLAGNMQNNVISGGSGNTVLWGGDYGDDVLIGGSGRDTFYFGKYEGNDVIKNISGGDKINLFDVNLSDFADISVRDNDIYFTFNQGGKLTIQGGRTTGNEIFLGEEGTTWKYNDAGGNWLQL